MTLRKILAQIVAALSDILRIVFNSFGQRFVGGFFGILAWRFRWEGLRSGINYFKSHSTNFYVKWRNARSRNHRVECPCCGWKGYDFLPLDGGKLFWVPHFFCPQCGGMDRHRVLHLYMRRHDADLFSKQGYSLHFAPEPQVRNILEPISGMYYTTSDIEVDKLLTTKGRAFRSDILRIPLRDNTVDAVVCLHLLEHIRDDHLGVAEIYRVLKPKGIAYIMVPVDLRLTKSVFFGRPHPDIYNHWWSHALDFDEKLRAFECKVIKPRDFLTADEVRRYRIPDKEVIFRCVKPACIPLPNDFEESDKLIWQSVTPYTMTSPERVYSLTRAIEYIVRAGIPGDFVECGVWKGGSSMAIALNLIRLKAIDRNLYLYDTFDTGWPPGGPEDLRFDGVTPHQLWLDALAAGQTPDTMFAKYDNVLAVMKSTGYPWENIHFVRGKVEETIPKVAPDRIALLRLDTDWYASTLHELEHLYPRLSPGGVLIIDDYGMFKGARQAVDEYFAKHKIEVLLHRIDDTGRIAVKPS